jgi:NADH-quinone oxidoreductase subunit L
VLDLVWLIPALPLAGFLILVLLGRKLGDPLAGWLATLMTAGAFVVTCIVGYGLYEKHAEERQFQQILFEWFNVGGLRIQVGFLVDPLSITMALVVTGVGALIHLYSIGYMRGDPKFSKFFIYLNLFAFSMLMLVLGNNLVLTFLGWEGVGACSYFLIAFWFTSESNASAGKKAFVTNRIGDWGFMVAMFLAFSATGTLTYYANGSHPGLLDNTTTIAAVTATAIAALLFVGAVGKSAQLPLYVWLPDAMAGPTPVSALIHAATMVTAGVYLMTRVSPLLAVSYDWLPWVIAIVGAVTAFFAATIAVAQTDIKKVLAYSTVSQLGYMFLAVGCGAYSAAIFMVIAHAFYKALLFLGAGSVIHGMHDEQDMRRMGGLFKYMKWTAVFFMVGWLTIAGLPPFAGFWAKDDILTAAYDKHIVLWFLGFVTAGLTAFYMSRQVFLVFWGNERWRDAHVDAEADDAHAEEHAHHAEPHESGALMLIPLGVLALLSITGGSLMLPFSETTKLLENWLEPSVQGARVVNVAGTTQVVLGVITTLLALFAIFLARRVYLQHKAKAFEPEVLAHGYYYDESIAAFVGGPGETAFNATATFDHNVIDGAINGVGGLVKWGGGQLRKLQTGYVRNYALGIAVGAFIFVGLFLTRVG